MEYSKLAEIMGFYTKNDPSKPDTKKTRSYWWNLKKKLSLDNLSASAAAPEKDEAKARSPATPRGKKGTDDPKTPQAKKTPAKKEDKSNGSMEGDATIDSKMKRPTKRNEDASTDAEEGKVTSHETIENEKSGSINSADAEVKGEPELGDKAAQAVATAAVALADIPDGADDDLKNDADAKDPPANIPVTPGTATSVADDMSAGSMSPTPPTKRIPTANTRKSSSTPMAQKSTGMRADATAATIHAPETPKASAPKATPAKRKNKSDHDATATEKDPDGLDIEAQPSSKKQKSLGGGAVDKRGGESDVSEPDGDDADSPKPTPTKTRRKPSAAQVAKKAEREREKAAKKAEKEKEKADKKAEKLREKAEKQAAKKARKSGAADGGGGGGGANGPEHIGESPKPKTPRKPTSAQQAKQAEKAKTGGETDSSISLAAQKEIDEKTKDVFGGARIDKAASATTIITNTATAPANENNSPGEGAEKGTNEAAATKPNGFTPINGSSAHHHDKSEHPTPSKSPAEETPAADVDDAQDDRAEENNLAIRKETTINVEIGN